MSPLLAPLFAQLISLQMADRTEGRYVSFAGVERFEGSTTPLAALSVSARRTAFQVAYAPSITVAPLETTPRQLFVFHQATTSLSYALRRTTFSLGGSFGIGSLDMRLIGVQGLQAPAPVATTAPVVGEAPAPGTGAPPVTPPTPNTGAPTTGTPTPGTPQPTTPGGAIPQSQQSEQRVRLYVATTALTVTHRLTKMAQVSLIAGETTASGRDDASRLIYPKLQGWSLGGNGTYTHPLSKQDSVIGNGSLIKTWSSNDSEVATLITTVNWAHAFSPRTAGTLGGGLNVTRFSDYTGLAGVTVYPTATVGATHQQPIGRGGVSFVFLAYSTPVLDPLRAQVDPRVGFSGNIVYTRKKLRVATIGNVAFSVAPDGNRGSSVNSAQGEARVTYAFMKLLAADTGARFTRQTYGPQTVIPMSWAVFVGLTFGYTAVLAGGR